MTAVQELTQLDQAVDRATARLLELQHPDGWWVGELESNATMIAQHLIHHLLSLVEMTGFRSFVNLMYRGIGVRRCYRRAGRNRQYPKCCGKYSNNISSDGNHFVSEGRSANRQGLGGIHSRGSKPRRRLHCEHPGQSDRPQLDSVAFGLTLEMNRLIHVQRTPRAEFKTTESIHLIERQ